MVALIEDTDRPLTLMEVLGEARTSPNVELRYAMDAGAKKIWRCEKCLLVQYLEADLRCRRCRSSYDLGMIQASGGRAESTDLAALQREVAEQGKALERLEGRIRRVEVESVQGLQGITQDRQDTRQEGLVN